MSRSRQELSGQNETLHQHLDSVSAQATRIWQAAEAPPDNVTNVEGETVAIGDEDSRLSELRSVVSYLHKEMICNWKWPNESGVLKNQIERLSQTLQETWGTLAEVSPTISDITKSLLTPLQERERVLQSTASAAQRDELVERINQLNIFA